MTFLSWQQATDSLSYDLHVRRWVSLASTVIVEDPEVTAPYMTGGDSTTWLPIPQAASVRWSILSNADWGVTHFTPGTGASKSVCALANLTTGSTATSIVTSSPLPALAYSSGQYALRIKAAGAWQWQICRIIGHQSLSATNTILVEAPGFNGTVPTSGQMEIIPMTLVGTRPNFYVYTSNADLFNPKDGGILVANPSAVWNPLTTPSALPLEWSASGEITIPHSYIGFCLQGPVFDPGSLSGTLATISVTMQNRGSM